MGSWRFWLGTVVATRAALLLIGFLSLTYENRAAPPVAPPRLAVDRVRSQLASVPFQGLPANLVLDGWTRGNGAAYCRVAVYGYSTTGQSDTWCWPFYPLAVSLLTRVLANHWLAGLLVSHLAFLVGSFLLYAMVGQQWGETVARRTLILWCVFPFSFYFAAVSPDSLLLALSLGAFELARRCLWWWAALLAALAAATHPLGILVGPALVGFYMQTLAFDWRRVGPALLGLLLLPAILPALHLRTHPESWDYLRSGPDSAWQGAGRLLSWLFPLFIAGARLLPEWLFWAIVYLSTLFLTLTTLLFVRGN